MSLIPSNILQLLKRQAESDEEFDELIDVWMRRKRAREERRHGGSIIGRKIVNRNIHEGHRSIMRDYFSPQPVFDDKMFRRRFRMR